MPNNKEDEEADLVSELNRLAVKGIQNNPLPGTHPYPLSLLQNYAFDEILEVEASSLSAEDRARADQEVRGIEATSGEVEESPDLLETKLAALRFSLDKIPEGKKEHYNLEVAGTKDGKQDARGRKLQLMFLRADRFDADAAAKRMVLFCKKKAQIFGEATLGRSLMYSDLSQRERSALKAGLFQLLPQRDRMGRLVFFESSICSDQMQKLQQVFVRIFWRRCLTLCFFRYPSQLVGSFFPPPPILASPCCLLSLHLIV